MKQIAGNAIADIAIVGGGMAGTGLALLLAQHLPSASVVLLEQHALQVTGAEQLSVPSFDARSTALSCSTQTILSDLGLWQPLAEHAEAILQVHVSERNRPLGMLMRAEETALPALGYVIENRQLGNVLLQALLQKPVQVLSPALVNGIKMSAHRATLDIRTGEQDVALDVKLVVIADGAQSALRQQLGIAVDNIPYDQHALVANVVTELPHGGVAFERFTETGPVALLPLKDHEQLKDHEEQYEIKHRAALIWTLPDSEIESIMQLPETEFLARVQERFGERCGRLLHVGSRHCYPLSLIRAREQVRSRVVLMGSAAHHLHPVAGQGFNLIMRDCVALAETLAPVARAGGDIGNLAVLQEYAGKQQWDQQKTVMASDWLPRLFSNRDRSRMLLRSLALLGLDFIPGVREKFAREATGLSV